MLDCGPIAVAAADDVAVAVKGKKELAVAAIDLEHPRARTDIERFGDVFRQGRKVQLVLVECRKIDRRRIDLNLPELRSRWDTIRKAAEIGRASCRERV